MNSYRSFRMTKSRIKFGKKDLSNEIEKSIASRLIGMPYILYSVQGLGHNYFWR